MDEFPQLIKDKKLWKQLGNNISLLAALQNLRSQVKILADTISKRLPEYTDHSIRHMDSLWDIADSILTEDEICKMTVGEVFLLSCSFYLHDIGMAYGATPEGTALIQQSDPYKQFISRGKGLFPDDKWLELKKKIEADAFSYAVRKLHPQLALQLATQQIPGSDTYLIEPKEIREAWGTTIGKISASHQWDLAQIHQELGAEGTVPLPSNVGCGDLGYVAILLRLIDFAHMNRHRALNLERIFRQNITANSLVHWLAQEQIDGPHRDGSELVYRSAKPIENVDAWWLFYNMLAGLDNEVRAARRYLDQFSSRRDRLSLCSVRGAYSPQEASILIKTNGFIPLEVNIRTGAIDRLVKLLGGETLYGENPLVPIRELIQNAQDALTLKKAMASTELEQIEALAPIQINIKSGENPYMEVIDHGVGISQLIMQDYLVTIASDYWNSELFHSDFPNAKEKGFLPAGRFGIGFISVFMIAEAVEVTSNRIGRERLHLSLRGLDRRGEIRILAPISGSGTVVKLWLKKDIVPHLLKLSASLKKITPMLKNSIEIDEDGKKTTIAPDWWKAFSKKEFIDMMRDLRTSSHCGFSHEYPRFLRRFGRHSKDENLESLWPEWPECIEGDRRIVAIPFSNYVVLCAFGIVIDILDMPGFMGLINMTSIRPDVSRSKILGFDIGSLRKETRAVLKNTVTSNLDALNKEHFVTTHYRFLEECIDSYGEEVLLQSSLRWLSLIKPPGDIETLSCADFLKRLLASSRLRIALGTGPWSAMKGWSAIKRDSKDLEIVPDISVSYELGMRDDEVHRGSLKEIWADYENSSILLLILKLIAQAWQTNLETLITGSFWERTRDKVNGTLIR